MHTVEFNGAVFNYNSDMSGMVTIRFKGYVIEVPGETLISFVANYVKGIKISLIEGADDHEILGLPIDKHIKV